MFLSKLNISVSYVVENILKMDGGKFFFFIFLGELHGNSLLLNLLETSIKFMINFRKPENLEELLHYFMVEKYPKAHFFLDEIPITDEGSRDVGSRDVNKFVGLKIESKGIFSSCSFC
jgi:hypothetical protein